MTEVKAGSYWTDQLRRAVYIIEEDEGEVRVKLIKRITEEKFVYYTRVDEYFYGYYRPLNSLEIALYV